MSDPTRAALEELGHQPTGDGDMCLHRWRNRTTRAVHCPFLAGWRAALAASREERPGLDVERLAEALFRTQAERLHGGLDGLGLGSHEADAAAIAREYAALSTDTPEAET